MEQENNEIKNLENEEEFNKEKEILIIDLDKNKKDLFELEKREDYLIKKKEQIINSEKYIFSNNLNIKQKEITIDFNKMKEKIVSDFSKLKKSLKKYQRLDINSEFEKKLIDNYIANELEALLIDSNLKIIDILNNLSRAISEKKISVKDKIINRIKEQIKKMNYEYLTDFIKKYNLIIENKKKLESEIQKNDVKKDLDKIEKEIHEIKNLQGSIKLKNDLMKQKLVSKEKWKKCSKCGKEIPNNWKHHLKCGWKENEEESREQESDYKKSEIMVFTSPTCPHCLLALNLAKQIKKERNVKVIEVNTATPHGQEKAKQMGIMAVPTIFVKGPAYPQVIGLKGLPSKKGLLKVVDISLGIEEWEESKGFFKNLFSKIKKKSNKSY